jgi:starch synthase
VIPYNQYTGQGNGFSFTNYNAHDMLFTIERAVDYYRDQAAWSLLVANAMQADFSWLSSAQQYAALYNTLLDKEAAHGAH